MAYRYYRVWVLLFCLAAISGCAPFAVRPPTPAKDMDTSGMWEPRPGERFYMTAFGSESIPKLPHLTHSWATVIRVAGRGQDQPPLIESHTISWMPATLKIRVESDRVEKGVNLGLHETLDYVLASGEHIWQWGPYECRPELYFRFLAQKEFLESGRIGYQCVDEVGEAAHKGNGCDCIHALTDMDPRFSRGHYPLIRHGVSGTHFAVEECRRHDLLINPSQTHSWLNAHLGLDSYPIIHRR